MTNLLYSNPAQFERCSGAPGVKPQEVGRTAFRKDYARLLHAPSFRRLQGKTQLLPGSESDFFRNRLTHSLEVAQIARGIAARLNASDVPAAFPGGAVEEDLVEFAAIAHDLGHPPFGHNGEYALDELMRDAGGFEGNAQTLRILAHVERKLYETATGVGFDCGLDLTYRTLASVLKYDKKIPDSRGRKAKLAKGYYSLEKDLVNEIKQRVAPGWKGKDFKTVECSIMDLADDIAYSTYDLEDTLHARFVTPLSLAHEVINSADVRASVMDKTNEALDKEGYARIADDREIRDVIGSVFPIQLPKLVAKKGKPTPSDAVEINVEAWRSDTSIAENGLVRTRLTAERVGKLISAVELVPNNAYPQLSRVRLRRDELLHVEILKHLNYEVVVRSPRLAVVEFRGRDVVAQIFRALLRSNGLLMPDGWKERFQAISKKDLVARKRCVCDFVSGMTDRYAAEFYRRLFGEGESVFKPL